MYVCLLSVYCFPGIHIYIYICILYCILWVIYIYIAYNWFSYWIEWYCHAYPIYTYSIHHNIQKTHQIRILDPMQDLEPGKPVDVEKNRFRWARFWLISFSHTAMPIIFGQIGIEPDGNISLPVKWEITWEILDMSRHGYPWRHADPCRKRYCIKGGVWGDFSTSVNVG